MNDCIFCKISGGEIPAEELYRDDDVIGIVDVNPQAPKHMLVVTRKHYGTMSEIVERGNEKLAGHMIAVAAKLARKAGIPQYRLVVNTGAEGGQTVDHVHVHVLGGRQMTWPPG